MRGMGVGAVRVAGGEERDYHDGPGRNGGICLLGAVDDARGPAGVEANAPHDRRMALLKGSVRELLRHLQRLHAWRRGARTRAPAIPLT